VDEGVNRKEEVVPRINLSIRRKKGKTEIPETRISKGGNKEFMSLKRKDA